MKKILIAGALLLISVATLMAQTPAKGKGNKAGQSQSKAQRPNLTPEQRADTVAKRMTKQLNLTADQTEQVRSITLTRAQKMEEVKTTYASNPQEKAKQSHAVREKWEADLHTILTPDQWSTYQAKKQARIDKAKQRRAQQQGANTNKTPEQIQNEIEEEAEQAE